MNTDRLSAPSADASFKVRCLIVRHRSTQGARKGRQNREQTMKAKTNTQTTQTTAPRALTLNEAKALSYGDTIYQLGARNYDGTARRWRVNGRPKTWKRTPSKVAVPVKHGLYDYGTLTQDELDQFSLTEPARCAKSARHGSL